MSVIRVPWLTLAPVAMMSFSYDTTSPLSNVSAFAARSAFVTRLLVK